MDDKKNIEESKNGFEFFTEINKKQDIIIPELTFKNIQTEMLLFKDSILKDINLLTKDIRDKHKKYDLTIKDEIKKINSFLKNTENNITNLSDLISVDKETKNKLQTLLEFKKKVEEYMITNDIRFSNLEKDFSDNIFRHDNIFKETVIYPAIIGPMCKFQNFHELIDYFINQIYGLLRYKEKNEIDLGLYKEKLETMISGFKLQIDNFMKSSTQFTRKTVNQAEERINTMLLKYDDMINVNRIKCLKNNTDLENVINNYKGINEDNIKNIIEENNLINNKLKTQKDDIKLIQDKIYEFNKKLRNNDYYGNNRLNRINYKSMNSKKEPKLIKSSSKVYEKDEKVNKTYNKNNKIDKKGNNQNNSEIKKSNTIITETVDSKTETQINNDIKNLETKLQNFIKNEIINLSKNIKNSLKKIKIENEKEKKMINIGINKDEISISKESEKQLVIKTDIEQEKKINNNIIKIGGPKRNSDIPINIQKEIFNKFIRKKKEDKNKYFKNTYIFERIKEVFCEESFDNGDEEKKIIKEIKKRNTNTNIPKISKLFYESIKKELKNKKSSNSTKVLPFVSNLKKKKKLNLPKQKVIHDIKYQNLQNKKIIKNPLINKPFIQAKNTRQKTEEKNLTQKINNKPKVVLNYIDQNINNILEHKIRPYSKNKNKNMNINNALTIETKKTKIKEKIEIKEEVIKTPKIERNQHLGNFTVTLQGIKKLNLEKIEKIPDNKIITNSPSSPTIYNNFPRTSFMLNERIIESLHPLYRNKKFSKYIRPYISALTNNFQTMLSHNEKKVMSQKKVKLSSNKSETNLMKNKNTVLKLKNEKEIKLPDIIDEEIENIKKHYSPGYKDKFQTLEEKEIFSFSSKNIQDIYLNKNNRFSFSNINKGARFINLKKKV